MDNEKDVVYGTFGNELFHISCLYARRVPRARLVPIPRAAAARVHLVVFALGQVVRVGELDAAPGDGRDRGRRHHVIE